MGIVGAPVVLTTRTRKRSSRAGVPSLRRKRSDASGWAFARATAEEAWEGWSEMSELFKGEEPTGRGMEGTRSPLTSKM